MSKSRSGHRGRAWKIGAAALAASGLALATAPAAGAAPTTPGQPTNVSITAGPRNVKVTFTAPTSNGGSKITNYRAKCTSSDGGKAGAHNGDKSPIKVGGLTAGKTYSCTVAAHNKVGYGSESTPSNSVVVKPTVPGPPTNVSATAGKRSGRVTFTKPADNGSAKIDDYRVKCTSSNGGVARQKDGDKSPIKVGGLTAGKTYSCTVAAHNKVGFGSPSSPSNDFVPTKK